jgi:hypothetical protein
LKNSFENQILMLQSLVAQLITFWEKEEVKRHFRSEIKASFDAQAEIQKS